MLNCQCLKVFVALFHTLDILVFLELSLYTIYHTIEIEE